MPRRCSPHRSRWNTYAVEDKRRLIHEHAATVFEDYCRGLYPDTARYREGDLELDTVRADRRHAFGHDVNTRVEPDESATHREPTQSEASLALGPSLSISPREIRWKWHKCTDGFCEVGA